MLALERADVFYGPAQALHGVSLSVAPGEVVALAGRNGAGKSTTLRALAGYLPVSGGRLLLDGRPVPAPTPEAMNRAGVALVPEDRQVFPTLTVEENLIVATIAHGRRAGRDALAQAWDLFPRLAERRTAYGQALSGGEQQMLSIARALLCRPKILLLDEPTEGLAPVVIETLVQALAAVIASGVGLVIVEQNFAVPQALATRFVVLDSGRILWRGDAAGLEREAATVSGLLSGLGGQAIPA